jgi:ribosomal RNA-processing protein 8
MFAVPGWAVSADILAQQSKIKPPKPIKSDVQKSQEQAFADSKSKSKKRKRPEGEPISSSKVSAADLEKLWNKQFGTKPAHDRGSKSKTASSSAIVEPTQHGDADAPAKNTTKQAKVKKSKTARSQDLDDGPGNTTEVDKSTISQGKHFKKANGTHGKVTKPKPGPSEAPTSSNNTTNPLSHKEKKRDKKKKHDDREPKHTPTSITTALPPPPVPLTLTPLQAKMRSKLTSARFRHLNQTLYTTTSASALSLFSTSPDLFLEYHAGFSQQVRDSWPLNPVDVYIRAVKTRGTVSETSAATAALQPLPRRKTGSCTIADLGCGDAPLARGCQSVVKDLQLKFHSFDLHAPNTHVTVADIAALPLRDGEADVVVFCLSLMGTNWVGFVEEGWRVLRGDGRGEFWVSEVKSRFGRGKRKGGVVENSVGKRRKVQQQKEEDDEVRGDVDGAETETGDETDISAFVSVFQRRGFELRPESVSKGNKMFVSMVFVKSGVPSAGAHKGKKWNGKEYKVVGDGRMRFTNSKGDEEGEEVDPEEEAKVLKPCVYKTR